MRSIIVVCVLASVALVNAETVLHPRGCIYIVGRCYKECPVGTHAYALGCGYKTPEATCRNPNPVAETAMLCDYSACYCDSPTVRDEKTDQCVLIENCSPQDPIPEEPKPEEPKPEEPKPEEPKPEEPKPEEPKPEEPKPEEPKPEEPKPEEPKPEEPKPEEPKPEEPKPTEPKPEQPKPEEPKSEVNDASAVAIAYAKAQA